MGIFGGGLGGFLDDLDPLDVGKGWIYDTPPPGKGQKMFGEGTGAKPYVYCPPNTPFALNVGLVSKYAQTIAGIKAATKDYQSGKQPTGKYPQTLVKELREFGNPFPRVVCKAPDYLPSMEGEMMAAWAHFESVEKAFWATVEGTDRVQVFMSPEQAEAAESKWLAEQEAGVAYDNGSGAFEGAVGDAKKPAWAMWAVGGVIAWLAIGALSTKKRTSD